MLTTTTAAQRDHRRLQRIRRRLLTVRDRHREVQTLVNLCIADPAGLHLTRLDVAAERLAEAIADALEVEESRDHA
jgi:hypothetical protein